ncbi:dihydroorotate dehydrogenase-like protein [bacterium]|nr:dihydroorotate dehydrogenase-like protein [bacterium]RQV98236.1 MAG: dihydroorotate dehydrogenase-like protein [bacterium]
MMLQTRYLGLNLNNPLVIASLPLAKDISSIRHMEDAGAAAVVLHSLFEEQILIEEKQLNENLLRGTESFAEALSYFPDISSFQLGPTAYLEHIKEVKRAVEIPVIASLNGISTGGWIEYAKKIEAAGADALELNIYFIPTNPAVMGDQVEQLYTVLVKDVTSSIKIPVAVKLSPFFSAAANMLKRIDQAGAKGLVLFNRFYQPDFDLDNLNVVPNLHLSHSGELTLRLRWAAILYGQLDCDLAITGGIHTAEDVIKSIMAGANATMMASAILKHGISHIQSVLSDMKEWMKKRDYNSIEDIRGLLSMKNIAEPTAYVRSNYMKVLGSYL